MMQTDANKKSFQDIISSENLVLVDFFATWCGPCKTMSPILDEVKQQAGQKVRILKVDVDKNNNAATAFQVRGVPTLILFKSGKPVWRQSGVVPGSDLLAVIRRYA